WRGPAHGEPASGRQCQVDDHDRDENAFRRQRLANKLGSSMSSEFKRPLNWMLPFVAIAAALEFAHADPLYTFLASAVAIIPLAGWMGRSTETVAEHLGAGAGGLLNATFGNAAVLIIAIMGMRAGLDGVVKASITGSIIGNILLVLGFSILAGGLKRREINFNRTAASLSATLLALSAVALIVPALFHRLAFGINRLPGT